MNKRLKVFLENVGDVFDIFGVFVIVFGIPILFILSFFAINPIISMLSVYLFFLVMSLWMRKDYQEEKRKKQKEGLAKVVEN